MTREEEIVNAAREYTDKVIFASPSTVLYFEAGAKWAYVFNSLPGGDV